VIRRALLLRPTEEYSREILYEACDLQKRIEPGSNAHPEVNIKYDWDDERHLEPIRSAVTKTRDLLGRLEDPEAPSDEFELAWNGIMPSRLRERRQRSFSVNVEHRGR
jgi:hypothetical protein